VKILIVGGGGREHALAWALLRSPKVSQVVCAPGNGGTATLAGCNNRPVAAMDQVGILNLARAEAVDLVVVGPEEPLAVGLADTLRAAEIPVFGPGRAGAQIEASKAWAKDLMRQAGIPTAQAAVFTEIQPALEYLEQVGVPIVIKADGLAAGKGVTVAQDFETARVALRASFGGQFGAAGQQVVIEEFLAGQEVSVLALTDGETIRPLVAAQDHKRLGEGDTGPNTGGMGAYAPTPLITPALQVQIQQQILEPAIAALRQRGIDYCGVLYAGLMITPDQTAKVVEFNCRFGDPETQVVLPLMETPLVDLLLACVNRQLAAQPEIVWRAGAAACVVLASGGYPGPYQRGFPIAGLAAAAETGAIVFQAGTRLADDAGVNSLTSAPVVTEGGRVLGVTALGADLTTAIATAYRAVDQIQFHAQYYRRDIGFRVRGSS